jgi:hypothetical protein
MDAEKRNLVRQRANHRCEYCRLPDTAIDLPFHVEHIIASVHHLDDSLNNLAWACPRCNLRKGPNLSTIDQATMEQVELFNPRTMGWSENFAIHGGIIEGTTACGRGTARLLDMNSEARVHLRRQLIEQGEFDIS